MTDHCRWDREREEYLRDGEPCKRDDYGDPTHHCTARRTCANHIGHGEITCARCIGRTRTDVRRIVALAPLMGIQALGTGVDSEAAMLAGPACDQEAWSRRKITARQGGPWHASLPTELGGDKKHVEDDDEFHAYSVLTRWEFMLRENYGQPRETPTSITAAGDYLDRILHRMAQDPEQDFALFRDEMRGCRNHLEAVLRNSAMPERGAPCPDCAKSGKVVRMCRHYGHWCDDPMCEQQYHYATALDRTTGEAVPDTTGDTWVCREGHKRSHEDYQRWIEERGTPRREVTA